MRTLKTAFFMICLVAAGCGNKNESVVEDVNITDIIKYSLSAKSTISQFVDSVRFIALVDSGKHLLKDVSKIYKLDDKIVLGDKRQHKIVAYDNGGSFLYEIDKRGAGPGEYLEIANFTATDSLIYALDNYGHCIYKYSVRDGSFVSKDEVPFVAWDIEAFDDENFLFTQIKNNPEAVLSSKQQPASGVWSTNGDWKLTADLITVPDDHYEMYGKGTYFFRSGDKIYFHTLWNNGYYVLAKNSAPAFVQVDFDNPLPQSFAGRLEEANEKSYEFVAETPFPMAGYTVFSINDGGEEQLCLYSHKDHKFYHNSDADAHNGMIEIKGVWDDSPFGIILEYGFYEGLIEGGFSRANPETEQLMRNECAALVIYYMK